MARKSSSQAPSLQTASFLWKEAEYCSHSEGLRYENAASPHSSFRANARNLFRSRSSKSRRTAGSGKHRASYDLKARCFMQADSRMKQIMANEKDPSTPLGMTIREHRFSHVSFHPAEGANLRPFLGKEGENRALASPLRILCGASDFYAPHHHFAFLISNFSFKRVFHPQTRETARPRG